MSLEFGDDSEKVTPVPIPNTEVNHLSADGSWGFTPVRVGRCQAKLNPYYNYRGLFFYKGKSFITSFLFGNSKFQTLCLSL